MEKDTFDNNRLLSDEELVAMFFAEQKQELPDDGFSKRVMQQLPSRSLRLSRIWTLVCSLLGIGLFFWADGFVQLKRLFLNAFGNLGGFLSSVDLSNISPMMVIFAIATFYLIIAWNVLVEVKR